MNIKPKQIVKLSKKIKLFDPVIDVEEEKTIIKVLKSRFWASGSSIGNVEKFEKKFNNYIGSNSTVAVNSGTAALHLALSIFDIKNKEVILPSISFVSTAHAIIYNGGKPVFADIDPLTLNIDQESISNSITNNTKVILPVHLGGLACDLDKIQKICTSSKIFLVEDAAHASGSKFNGKKIGTHGSAVCFSFHPIKNLAMPIGGAITLNIQKNNKFKKILQSKRWCGISNRKGVDYDVSMLGWNYYMNEFSAAIGLAQLKKLDRLNLKRKQIAKRYFNEIMFSEKMPFDSDCSYHLYWIRVKDRSTFMKNMKRNDVETGIHYKPIHKMSFYKSTKRLPNTEMVSKQLVSLPIHPNLSNFDVSKIIKLVNRFA